MTSSACEFLNTVSAIASMPPNVQSVPLRLHRCVTSDILRNMNRIGIIHARHAMDAMFTHTGDSESILKKREG